MDKILMIEIVEPILIWIVSVGMAVEVMSGGVLHTILIMSIHWGQRECYPGGKLRVF